MPWEVLKKHAFIANMFVPLYITCFGNVLRTHTVILLLDPTMCCRNDLRGPLLTLLRWTMTTNYQGLLQLHVLMCCSSATMRTRSTTILAIASGLRCGCGQVRAASLPTTTTQSVFIRTAISSCERRCANHDFLSPSSLSTVGFKVSQVKWMASIQSVGCQGSSSPYHVDISESWNIRLVSWPSPSVFFFPNWFLWYFLCYCFHFLFHLWNSSSQWHSMTYQWPCQVFREHLAGRKLWPCQ